MTRLTYLVLGNSDVLINERKFLGVCELEAKMLITQLTFFM